MENRLAYRRAARSTRRTDSAAWLVLVALAAAGCPGQPAPVEPRAHPTGDAEAVPPIPPDGMSSPLEIDEALGCYSSAAGEAPEPVEWHSSDEVGEGEGPCPPREPSYDAYAGYAYGEGSYDEYAAESSGAPPAEDPAAAEREQAARAAVDGFSELVARGRLQEAEDSLRVWLARLESCEPRRYYDEARELLRRALWLQTVEETVTAQGGRFLDHARRVFARCGPGFRMRPGDERLIWREGDYAGTNTPLDVWAELPDGWVLVAWPQRSPDGVVRGNLWAIAGWLGPDDIMAEAFGPRTLDVGNPIRIARGPAFESDAFDMDGQTCETHGEAGLSYVFVDLESECVPYREICGAPGVVPIDFTVLDLSLSGGCFDCPDEIRSDAGVGRYCRAPTPGWTWQCSPDNRLLVCTPPAGDEDAAALAVPPPTIQTPQEAAQQAVTEYEAYVAAHTAQTELAELRARFAEPYTGSDDPLLGFLEHAHPAELFALVCDGTAAERSDSILGGLAAAGFFEQPLDAGQLECVERLAQTSIQLQAEVCRVPDERLRPVLERIAEQPLLPQFMPFAKAALALLDVAEGGPLESVVRDLAAQASAAAASGSTEFVDLHNELLEVLRGYTERTSDPRPLVPVLIDLLRGEDLSTEVADMIQNTLSDLAGQRLNGAEAWQQFWATNGDQPVDEWLAEALAEANDDDKWSMIRAVGARPPSDTGREALVAALSSSNRSVRLAAAQALARWRDLRAVPVLVRFLPDINAFTALGWLCDQSFGFDWTAPEEEQAAAVARWREWARRLQP